MLLSLIEGNLPKQGLGVGEAMIRSGSSPGEALGGPEQTYFAEKPSNEARKGPELLRQELVLDDWAGAHR